MAENKEHRIEFQLDFKTGEVKAFDNIKRQLQEVKNLASNINMGLSPSEMQTTLSSVHTLEQALNKAFDPTLNTVNVQKFNQILKNSGLNAKTLQANLNNVGSAGQEAFLKTTAQLMQFNTATKQTHKLLDNISTTLFNTVKWTITSSIVQNIGRGIREAYYYVKDLDRGLNDIRIVTGKSADEMSRFSKEANEAAKSLAVTTKDYTQGSLIYYQQGLDDETVKTLTDITAKTSNVTGQSMETVSEELTAVWNGYQVANQAAIEGMQVYEEYVDKMAAVGATTASDLEEISTAMSKVASAASSMGVGFDDLTAQIATIVSVTRQAPETAGNALKTIYARLGDLKVDGVDEFGTKLGDVSKQLHIMGIEIVDQEGNMRDMSSVMAEVASKWQTQTSAQQEAAAVAMAGKRQYNNLIALFNNQDTIYKGALETAGDAAGTLERQQSIAMESISNKMDVLKATAEDLYDSLFDTDTIISFIESGTKVLQFLADFTDSVGGLNNILPMLLTTMTGLFSSQIANGIGAIVNNFRIANEQEKMMAENAEQLRLIFADSDLQKISNNANVQAASQQGLNSLKEFYNEMQQYSSLMNRDEKEQYKLLLDNIEKVGTMNKKVAEQEEFQKSNTNSIKIINNELLTGEENEEKLLEEAQKLEIVAKAISEFKIEGGEFRGEKGLFTSLKENLQELQEEFELTDEQIEILQKEFNKLRQTEVDGVFLDAGQASKELIKILNSLSGSTKNIVNMRSEMRNLKDATDNVGESLRRNLDTRLTIQNITKTISGMGQLAMSINTLKNLGSIQSNDDLETGDRILQTMMNISFAVSGLGMALKTLKDTSLGKGLLQGITSLQGMLTASMAKHSAAVAVNNAVSEAGNQIQQREVANILKKITASQLEAAANDKLNAGLIKETILRGKSRKLTDQQSAALDKAIAARIAEAKATDSATASQTAFNASLLANPITQVIAGITALIGTLAILDSIHHNNIKQQKEGNKVSIESANKTLEQAKNNETLYDSYMKTYEAYKENTASIADMEKATVDLLEVYDIENDKLAALTGNYDSLTEAIRRKRIEEAQEAKEAAETKKAKYETNAFLDLDETDHQYGATSYNAETKGYTLVLGDSLSSAVGDIDEGEGLKQLYAAINNNIVGNTKFLSSQGENGKIDLAMFNMNSIEDIVDTYDTILAAQEELSKSGDVAQASTGQQQELSEQLDTVKEDVEGYKEAVKELAQYSAQLEVLNIDFSKINSIEELQEKIVQLRETLKEQNPTLDESEINNMVHEYVSKQGTGVASLLKETEVVEAIAEKTKQDFEDIHKWQEGLPPEKKSLVLEGKVDFRFATTKELMEKEIQLAFENYGTFDVTAPVQLAENIASGNKLKKADKESLGTLNSEVESAMGGFEQKGMYHQMEVIDEIAQYRIDKNEEYLQNTEECIEKELELRKEEQEEIFSSSEYLAAKRRVNEEDISEEEKKNLEDKIYLYEELRDIISDLENFNGLSFNEIEDIGFNDLISDLDMIVSKSETIKNAAELIGAGFTVAASDVEKFSNMFPELLEKSKVLTDGSLKLDKEVLTTRLGDIQTEMEARTKAKVLEIDQQIALKEIEQEYLKKKLENLTKYLKGEQSAQDTIDAINLAGQEYREGLMELTGQDIKDLEATAINSANEEGKALISMLNTVGEGFAQAAKAHYAMINRENFDQQDLNFSGTASSAEEFALNAGGRAAALRAKAQQEYDDIYKNAQETQEALNIVTGELDELRAKKGVLQSTNQAATNALNRVARGQAGKADSKSNKDKDKDKKEQEDEFDRYQEIKKAIDAVDRAMKRLEKDQENLYGYELIASLQQENQLLEQQTANYERLYEMQQQEAAELREQLGTMGVIFDASGAITNYAAATSAALQAYAAALEQYNAGLIDETTLKVYEKSYEKFKKLLERYDQLYYTEMQDTQDKIDEMHRKQLANNLKAQETEIKIHLDMEKAKRDWNDFLKDIKQDFRKVFKDLTIDVKYDEKNFKSFVNDVGTTTKAIKDVEAEIDKMMGGGESDMFESVSQAQEKLKELQEQLIDQGKSLYELYKQVQETYLEGIDQVKDQFDELIKRYEHFTNLLDFHKSLIELLYGDKAYDLMDKYYEAQEKNTLAQIDSMRKQIDFQDSEFTKSYQTALKAGSKVDLEDFTTWTEDMKKAYENMIESQESLNDLILEAAKILKNQYLNSLNKISDTLEKDLQGMSSDDMKKDWEFMKEMADTFLDDTQKAYKIQSLANKIDQSAAVANTVKAQQKLQALREREVKDLRESKNLTQEEIDLAEARYQIALKEIALEEAQNNKTSMKLTRNEQGNQSYQYVADEDDTASKQQDLLDSLANYYEMAVRYTTEGGDLIIDQTTRMNEEIAQAYIDHADNIELAQQKEMEIRAKYEPIILAMTDKVKGYQNEAIYATSKIFSTVCDQDATTYETLTEKQKTMVDSYRDAGVADFNELRGLIIDGYYPDLLKEATEVFKETNKISHSTALQMINEQAADNGTSFKAAINKAVDSMRDALKKYQSDLDKLQEVAGIDFNKIGDYIDKVSKKIDGMSGTTEKMVDKSSQYLDELRRVLEAIAEAQDKVSRQIIDAQNELQNYLAMMGAVRQAQTGSQGNGTGTGSASDKSGSGNGGSEGSPSASKKEGHFDHTEISPTANGQQYERDIQIDSDGNKYVKEIRGPFGSKNQTWDPDANNNSSNNSNSSKRSGQDLRDRSGFATGGYTGEQDNSGRLAVLHQKELVLNADDTKNFLDGITMIRDMSSLNGSISNAIVSAIGGMALSLGNVKAGIGPSMTSSSTTTDNNIFNITAEFPNANDVNDIREAILSLPNYVSQYVGRNVR